MSSSAGDTVPDPPPTPSKALRLQGNALYKSHKFTEAIEHYQRAYESDPTDPHPLANISVVQFEIGDYTSCLTTISRAIEAESLLLLERPEKILALKLRRLRCQFHLGRCTDFLELAEALLKAPPVPLDENMKTEVSTLKQVVEKNCAPGTNKTPAYRPVTMGPKFRDAVWRDCPEYYPRGHDDAEPLVNHKELLAMARPVNVNLFYGGVGDARHVFQQIHHIAAWDRVKNTTPGTAGSGCATGGVAGFLGHLTALRQDRFSLMLCDISPHVIARDLIMFTLLNEIGAVPPSVSRGTGDAQSRQAAKEREYERTKDLSTLVYLFAADIMPKFAHDRICGIMKTLAAAGEDQHPPIPWVRLGRTALEKVRAVYRTWLSPKTQVRYDVAHAQRMENEATKQEDRVMLDKMWQNVEVAREAEMYRVTRAFWPPREVMAQGKEEEEMRGLLFGGKKGGKERAESVRNYIREKWKVNMTMWDPRLEFSPWRCCWHDTAHPLQNLTCFRTYATSFAAQDAAAFLRRTGRRMSPMTRSSSAPPVGLTTVEVLNIYFSGIADYLYKHPTTVSLDFRLSDCFTLLDTLRFNPKPPRKTARKFHGIHLSNIPDYTGGHLTVLLHCAPMLCPPPKKISSLGTGQQEGGFVQFNCLANTGIWDNLDHSLSEYLSLPSLSAVSHLLGLSLKSGEHYNPADGWVSMLHEYRWIYRPAASPSDLINKDDLTIYLINIFLHLALPTKRDPEQRAWPGSVPCRIHQPLTISTFLRLCVFLISHRHYPAHWITSVITRLLSGSITTSAQHRQSCPLPVADLQAKPSTPSRVSTIPFLPELRTLLIQHLPTLPIRIPLPLPPPSTLVEISLHLWPDTDTMASVLSLVIARNLGDVMTDIELSFPWPNMSLKEFEARRCIYSEIVDGRAGLSEGNGKGQVYVFGEIWWAGEWTGDFRAVDSVDGMPAAGCGCDGCGHNGPSPPSGAKTTATTNTNSSNASTPAAATAAAEKDAAGEATTPATGIGKKKRRRNKRGKGGLAPGEELGMGMEPRGSVEERKLEVRVWMEEERWKRWAVEEDGWEAALVRTDLWTVASSVENVAGGKVRRKGWTRGE